MTRYRYLTVIPSDVVTKYHDFYSLLSGIPLLGGHIFPPLLSSYPRWQTTMKHVVLLHWSLLPLTGRRPDIPAVPAIPQSVGKHVECMSR